MRTRALGRHLQLSVFLAVAVLCAVTLSGESPKLAIPVLQQPLTISDVLSGKETGAAVVRDFIQRDPADGKPATEQTTAYVGYTRSALEVVFVCKDSKVDELRARMGKRESILNDDLVGIVVDTYHDRQRAYEFLVNPFGIQADAMCAEGKDDDYNFETVWQSDGQITADGYAVHISVPFRSLRFSAEPRQSWGFALLRLMQRNGEVSFWPYITRKEVGMIRQMATLQGLEGISPGRNILLIPYGFAAAARYLDSNAPQYVTDSDWRGGLDAKAVFHDSLTLDAALNPDFSQVESDEPQVTVNQRFEVFFPEKRPFFLENAGYFSTYQDLFFSRRVQNPQFGARFTGKLGRWALGGIAIDDRAPGQQVPPGDPVAGERAVDGVFRLQREFGEQSNAGILFTSRDFSSSFNRVAEFDTRLKFASNWVFNGQVGGSQTEELNGEKKSGPIGFGEISYSSLNLEAFTSVTHRDRDFRAYLGYVPRVDMTQWEGRLEYTWKPAGEWLVNYGPSFYGYEIWDNSGAPVESWQEIEGSVELKGRTEIEAGVVRNMEVYSGIEFRKQSAGLTFSNMSIPWLDLSGEYWRGERTNYYPPPGMLPFVGTYDDAKLQATIRTGRRLTWDLTYIFSRLRTDSASVYNDHIARLKLNYQFSRALSARAILDWNNVLPNTSLVQLERDKRFTADLLLTYQVNPWTALYVGYTDSYQNVGLQEFEPQIERIDGLNSVGRQVFVKLSYLFNY